MVVGAPLDLTPYLWPELDDGRQPQFITEINWDDPITNGLILVAPLGLMGEGVRNLVDGKPPSFYGPGSSAVLTDYGHARKFSRVTDGSTRIVFDVGALPGDNAGAAVCSAGSATSAGRVLAGLWGLNGSSYNSAHYLGIESGGQVAAITTNNGAWQLAGGANISAYGYDLRHVFAGNFSMDSRELFVDGLSRATNATAVSISSSPDKIMVGSYWYGPGNSWDSGWDGYADLVLWWSRKLTAAEHARINATNGNCVFRAPSQVFAFLDAQSASEVSSDLSIAYAITGDVSSDLPITYGISESVSSDLSLSWPLFCAVDNSLTLAYDVLAGVSSDLTIGWAIFGNVDADLALSFAIEGSTVSVSADLAIAYSILSAAEKDLAISFGIAGAIVSDLTMSWQVFGIEPVKSDALQVLRAVTGSVPSESSVLPSIPAAPTTGNVSIDAFFGAVKLWLEKASSSGMTGLATKADLVAAGVLQQDVKGNLVTVDKVSDPDLTIPPAPLGLAAAGAMTNILVTWDAPTYGNHAYTEVWAAETDNFSVAVMVGTTIGHVFSHPVGEGSTRYYWIRFVSLTGSATVPGIKGPFNGVDGTVGHTSENPEYLLGVLTGSLGAQPFYQLTEDTVIDGVTVPAGVYMKSAMFANASITNAMIKALSADKITTGKLTADRIDGTNLSVVDGEFSGLLQGARGSFSGALVAATGTFSGELAGATGTFSGRLMAGTLDPGAFAGESLTYPQNGTFTLTVPSHPTWSAVAMRVYLVGAGGGGGAATSGWVHDGYTDTKAPGELGNVRTYYAHCYVGSGGQEGSSLRVDVGVVTSGAQYSLVIGKGGTPGVAGTSTAVTGIATAAGGAAGTSSFRSRSGRSRDYPAAPGGSGGSSAYGAGGVGVAGGIGGNASGNAAGGAGGGVGATYGGGGSLYAGGDGTDGYAVIEFYDPNAVVTNTRYAALITWLDGRLGTVPANAR